MEPLDISAVEVRDILAESLGHTFAMVPVLFAVFLVMEFISHGARSTWISGALKRGVAGPAAASALGLLPQCGFSVAATLLYVEDLIPTGSLLASYIATSDEALPILVASPSTLPWIMPLLAIKFAWATVVGTAVNLASRAWSKETRGDGTDRRAAPSHRESSGSCVGEKARLREYLPHAAYRTARTAAMVFVLSALLDVAGQIAGYRLPGVPAGPGPWYPLAASVFGLIPSCATSVALAEGFRSGLVTFPALLSGLVANSGMGLLVLLKESGRPSKTLTVVALLISSAYAAGYLASLFLS